MKSMTGIALTGLAMFFAGCSSEKSHDQAVDKGVNNHADAAKSRAGVNNLPAQRDTVVNQAAGNAQSAISTVQYTANQAAADAHAVVADAAHSAAKVTTDAEQTAAAAQRVTNGAARTGQDAINSAQRDVNALQNALR